MEYIKNEIKSIFINMNKLDVFLTIVATLTSLFVILMCSGLVIFDLWKYKVIVLISVLILCHI